MGRKRNQGKARRAAKAKAREEAERRGDNTQALSAAAQIQQFQIDEEKCKHGLFDPSISTYITQFVDIFHSSFITSTQRNLGLRLYDAYNASRVQFAEVWEDAAKMEMAISCLSCLGTQAILDNKYNHARDFAVSARYFEQYIAVKLKQTQALYYWPKIHETYEADIHTLVKFFRHRILCSCLDEMYEEVKHITKMGCCYNPQCSLPNKRVERSKAKYCSRCRCATYCSRECQEADWSRHKSDCDEEVSIIAEFVAKQLVAKQQNI